MNYVPGDVFILILFDIEMTNDLKLFKDFVIQLWEQKLLYSSFCDVISTIFFQHKKPFPYKQTNKKWFASGQYWQGIWNFAFVELREIDTAH